MVVSEEFGWTILSILVSALLSGLLGVWISNRSFKLNEIRKLKFAVFQQLMANRFSKNKEEFVQAINQIPIVFSESKEVLSAFKAYYEYCLADSPRDLTVENQKLLDLFKAMAKHLKIETDPLNDNFFLYPFSPRSYPDKEGIKL
ncbi:MAG: DUF6680 family protein [Candidatus Bathyarchaeia archaeon]|jgi:hypothetical protein